MLKLLHDSVGMFEVATKKYDFAWRKQRRELRKNMLPAVADPGEEVVKSACVVSTDMVAVLIRS
jgi:hypothetical protein